MFKKIQIGFVMLLALGIVGVVWFLQGNRTQTVMPTLLSQDEHVWSKYENPNREFTLEYPSDILKPREGDTGEPSVVTFDRSDPSVFVGMQISSLGTTYPDINSYYAQYPRIQGLLPVTIGGVHGLKQLDIQNSFTTIFFVHKGKIYTLTMNLSSVDVEHIQQNFHFTN